MNQDSKPVLTTNNIKYVYNIYIYFIFNKCKHVTLLFNVLQKKKFKLYSNLKIYKHLFLGIVNIL